MKKFSKAEIDLLLSGLDPQTTIPNLTNDYIFIHRSVIDKVMCREVLPSYQVAEDISDIINAARQQKEGTFAIGDWVKAIEYNEIYKIDHIGEFYGEPQYESKDNFWGKPADKLRHVTVYDYMAHLDREYYKEKP